MTASHSPSAPGLPRNAGICPPSASSQAVVHREFPSRVSTLLRSETTVGRALSPPGGSSARLREIHCHLPAHLETRQFREHFAGTRARQWDRPSNRVPGPARNNCRGYSRACNSCRPASSLPTVNMQAVLVPFIAHRSGTEGAGRHDDARCRVEPVVGRPRVPEAKAPAPYRASTVPAVPSRIHASGAVFPWRAAQASPAPICG